MPIVYYGLKKHMLEKGDIANFCNTVRKMCLYQKKGLNQNKLVFSLWILPQSTWFTSCKWFKIQGEYRTQLKQQQYKS